MQILVTGVAGFIGMHLSLRLLELGHEVTGLDNLNDYYDVNLKKARLEHITQMHQGAQPRFSFHSFDLENKAELDSLCDTRRPDIIINLAAQAGVRYSLENPLAYINSNVIGFTHILEASRHFGVQQLIYASSSSVYGLNETMPFSEQDNVDHPLALYGATKKSNELLAHSYSHLFGLPTTGLRFFTVYGPWGRPDMALFKFTKAILNGEPIDVYNHGKMSRDFTYIDDLVGGMRLLIDAVPEVVDTSEDDHDARDSKSKVAPFRVVNIGNSKPVQLLDYIRAIEKSIGTEAVKNFMPMQQGDVPATWADTALLHSLTGYKPNTDFYIGVRNFVYWYRKYYRV